MIFSKNRIKHILKSKNKKQTKKNLKKNKRKKKNHNSFRKKKRNLRIQTIKHNKHKRRIAKKKRKAYIHKGGQKIKIVHNYKNNFNHTNNLNKYILPIIYEEEEYKNAFNQYGGDEPGEASADDKNKENEVKVEKPTQETPVENATDTNDTGKTTNADEENNSNNDYDTQGHSEKLIDARNNDLTDPEIKIDKLQDEIQDAKKQEEIDKAREEGRRDGIVEGQNTNAPSGDAPSGDAPSGDAPPSDAPSGELSKVKFQNFFEIGFLFNESEDLKIRVLSDEDVSKTTEKAKDEEQETSDNKEEKKKKEKRKPKGIKEKFDFDQECNERMLFTTDPGSIGVWTRPKGKCSPDLKVWGKIAKIIGIGNS